MIPAPGYVARLAGRLAPPFVVVQVRVLTEDGARTEIEALEVIGGDAVGRLVLIEWGAGGHAYPSEAMPGGAVRQLADGGLVVEYLPGLRGGLGETGVILEPITVKSYNAVREAHPDHPLITDEPGLLKWLRSGSMAE